VLSARVLFRMLVRWVVLLSVLWGRQEPVCFNFDTFSVGCFGLLRATYVLLCMVLHLIIRTIFCAKNTSTKNSSNTPVCWYGDVESVSGNLKA